MKVIVIGAGLSGVMAALHAKKAGADQVEIFEKENDFLKIFQGYNSNGCLSSALSNHEKIAHLCRNPFIMHAMFAAYSNEDLMNDLQKAGLDCTIKNDRIYPVSMKAADVKEAFTQMLVDAKVIIRFNHEVTNLYLKDKNCCGVIVNGEVMSADAVIAACSDDTLLRKMGVETTKRYPGLTGINTIESDREKLIGVSLNDVSCTISKDGKQLFKASGDCVFTQTGISGPLMMKAARTLIEKGMVNDALKIADVECTLDLTRIKNEHELEMKILDAMKQSPNRQFKKILQMFLKNPLVIPVMKKAGIPVDCICHDLNKEQRKLCLYTMKHFPLRLYTLGNYAQADTVVGGVSLKAMDMKTLGIKSIHHLHICGALLDCDADDSAINLAIAIVSGVKAGESCVCQ